MSGSASLEALLADAIVSDYPESENMQRPSAALAATSALAILGAAFLLGLSVRSNSDQANQNLLTRQALVSRVYAADKRVSVLEQKALQAQRDLQAAEEAKLNGTSLGEQAQNRLERLRRAEGFTPVSGQGIEVLVDNAPLEVGADKVNQPGTVLDQDLQMVVNGLWQSGATAIAINDRRLTSFSAIRAAGEAILVNYRPLVPPYRVKAIAPDANSMGGRFRDSQGGLLLEELEVKYGVVWELNFVGTISLPAASNESN